MHASPKLCSSTDECSVQILRFFKLPGADLLLLSGSGTACILQTGQQLVHLVDLAATRGTGHQIQGLDSSISAAAVFPTSPEVVLGGLNGDVRVWRLDRNEEVAYVPGPLKSDSSEAEDCAVSHLACNSDCIAVVNGRTINVYSKSLCPVRTLPKTDRAVSELDWLTEHTLVAVCTDHIVTWHFSGDGHAVPGPVLVLDVLGSIHHMSTSPCTDLVAAMSEDLVHVWSLTDETMNGKVMPMCTFEGPTGEQPSCVGWHPNGVLVLAAFGCELYAWDVQECTNSKPTSFIACGGFDKGSTITAVAAQPNSMLLAALAHTGHVLVFDCVALASAQPGSVVLPLARCAATHTDDTLAVHLAWHGSNTLVVGTEGGEVACLRVSVNQPSQGVHACAPSVHRQHSSREGSAGGVRSPLGRSGRASASEQSSDVDTGSKGASRTNSHRQPASTPMLVKPTPGPSGHTQLPQPRSLDASLHTQQLLHNDLMLAGMTFSQPATLGHQASAPNTRPASDTMIGAFAAQIMAQNNITSAGLGHNYNSVGPLGWAAMGGNSLPAQPQTLMGGFGMGPSIIGGNTMALAARLAGMAGGVPDGVNQFSTGLTPQEAIRQAGHTLDMMHGGGGPQPLLNPGSPALHSFPSGLHGGAVLGHIDPTLMAQDTSMSAGMGQSDLTASVLAMRMHGQFGQGIRTRSLGRDAVGGWAPQVAAGQDLAQALMLDGTFGFPDVHMGQPLGSAWGSGGAGGNGGAGGSGWGSVGPIQGQARQQPQPPPGSDGSQKKGRGVDGVAQVSAQGQGWGSGEGEGGAGASPAAGTDALQDPDQVTNIYVGNLAPTVGVAALEAVFSQFGALVLAEVITDPVKGKSKGFGFVEFGSPASAALAMRHMHGMQLPGPFQDRVVKVLPSYRTGPVAPPGSGPGGGKAAGGVGTPTGLLPRGSSSGLQQ